MLSDDSPFILVIARLCETLAARLLISYSIPAEQMPAEFY